MGTRRARRRLILALCLLFMTLSWHAAEAAPQTVGTSSWSWGGTSF